MCKCGIIVSYCITIKCVIFFPVGRYFKLNLVLSVNTPLLAPKLYVDFASFFFFISHAVQFLDARRTKVRSLFAVNLFAKCSVVSCVVFCLCRIDAAILLSKLIHNFH